jgi:DNA mismatch repair protein MutS2
MIPSITLEKLEYKKITEHVSKYCQTELGRQKTKELKPFEDFDELVAETDLVKEANSILIKSDYPPIQSLPDLTDSLLRAKVEGLVLDSKKFLDIFRLINSSRQLQSFFNNNIEIAPRLKELSQQLYVDKMLEFNISKIINESGEVKDNASPKLQQIKREIQAKNDELIKAVSRIVKNLTEKDYVREDYMTLRDGRIVIPVKAEHKRHIKGFIHSESSTGQTVYIEPAETLELNNEIVSLSFAEKREIERLLKELTKLIGVCSGELINSFGLYSGIDSVFARAKFAIEIIGAFPSFNRKKPFELWDARHPLLLKKIGRDKTIPLTAKIKEKNVVLITGPNAGGKSVVLKTIGLVSLMALSAIPAPISPDSNIYFFDSVLLDIGDAQSLEDDLSTFSSHLKNIKEIISFSDSDSLILIDEIGTGTDPAEGSALAAATLIELQGKGALVFATTHHGNLKLVANSLSGFENAAMEFDNKNLRPTYRFMQGIPGSSYAFEIAKRLGFEDSFLNTAKEYLNEDKNSIEKLLIEVEARSQSLNEKMKNLEIENSRLAGLSNLYKNSLEKIENQKKEIIKNAKIEAERYLSEVNRKVENAIKEIKESGAKTEVIRKEKEIIHDLKEKNKTLFKEEPEIPVKKEEIKPGSFVAVKNTNTVGKIIEINKDHAYLLVGSIKIKVPVENLVPAKAQKEEKTEYSNTGYELKTPGLRIDIRGKKPDEAEFEVIRFLDDCYSSGINRAEILHGKGTGALKLMVKEVLKRHPRVKGASFAPVDFGGDGITIVDFE